MDIQAKNREFDNMTEDAIAPLAELIERERHWEERRLSDERLAAGIARLQTTIDGIEEKFRVESLTLEQKINEARELSSHIPDLEKESEILSRELNRLLKVQKRRDEITEHGLRDRIELDWIKDQIAELIVTKTDLKEKVVAMQDEIARLRREYVEAETELRQLPSVEKRLTANEFWLEQARKAALDGRKLQDELQRLRYKLDHHTVTRKERQAIADLERERDVLAYRPDQHRELKNRIYELAAALRPVTNA